MPTHRWWTILIAMALGPSAASAQTQQAATKVALVKMPYSGARNVPELSPVPDYLETGWDRRHAAASGPHRQTDR